MGTLICYFSHSIFYQVSYQLFLECFGHFYIVDFHSALNFQVSVWKSEGWVKIYNVKVSKTEMACAPPKSCRNQKSFWDPSTYHPNTTGMGWTFFISKKHVLVGHPNDNTYNQLYSSVLYCSVLFCALSVQTYFSELFCSVLSCNFFCITICT